MSVELSAGHMEFLLRLLIAALLGALIGFERDIHGRAAGLRTHLLVSMGAAAFVILSLLISSVGGPAQRVGAASPDPGRIAAQVVTGIGFLGAGAIIKEGLTIRGLTTAASLWVVAGIGMASGAGYYRIAAAATAIAIVSLVGLKYLERFYQKDSYRTLTVVTNNNVDVSKIIDLFKRRDLKVIFFAFERDYVAEATTVKLSLRLFHKGITDTLFHGVIRSLEQAEIPLKSIRWDRP